MAGGFGAPAGPFPQQPGFGQQPQQPGQPGQPQVPFQSIPGVYPGMGYPAPQRPGQPPLNDPLNRGGMPFQMPLPSHYQSPYASYGFDSGLQSYLDQQHYRSATDAGTSFQYDPTNQTFTGGTMAGQYNPIPLNVMQEVSGGNYGALSPYFQSKYPQPTGPAPTVKPGTFNPYEGRPNVVQPGPNVPQGPRPGANIGRPAPGYGQRPERGRARRDLAPMGTQGLGSLLNRR